MQMPPLIGWPDQQLPSDSQAAIPRCRMASCTNNQLCRFESHVYCCTTNGTPLKSPGDFYEIAPQVESVERNQITTKPNGITKERSVDHANVTEIFKQIVCESEEATCRP